MAAHGAVLSGASELRIFSKKRKSELFGAQYLHAPIPDISRNGPVTVEYKLLGTAAGYRAKVYGDDYNGTVSPEDLTERHLAWDIRETYDRLWGLYAEYVQDFPLDPLSVNAIREGKPDVIFNSIPRPVLCKVGHQFKGTKIWAAGDAPERGKMIPYKQCPTNAVLCNGDPESAWYRLSNIFGHRTVEFPDYARPPIEVAEVMKPTFTNCDCSDDMVHVGRYGRWEKGWLSHEAFQVAQNVVGAFHDAL
jgi:hypothetical protein